MLASRRIDSPKLDDMLSQRDLLSTFDVDDIATEALLFQTGYLTIRGEERRGGKTYYRLGYPNREVRQSLNENLLRHLLGRPPTLAEHTARLYDLLLANDFAGLESLFRALFAGIPYEWHTKNEIARYEGYYASVFYSCFAALGLDVTVEDSSSHGRLDMAVRFNSNVYLFELKVVGGSAGERTTASPARTGALDSDDASTGRAMAQLKQKGYADKYRHLGQPIHLIGVELDRDSRNVASWEVELV